MLLNATFLLYNKVFLLPIHNSASILGLSVTCHPALLWGQYMTLQAITMRAGLGAPISLGQE